MSESRGEAVARGDVPGFLAGGGEMGERMRAHDWAATPLGPIEDWPQSLCSAVSIMLNSRFPIALYWGPELALLYNDAWSPIPGGKHPWALGRPGREVWPEIWDTIGPLYERVLTTGEGIWQEDELLTMRRHGYLEECYFNFTFSPVRGEDGTIDGIFNAVVETTERVLSERRLRTLSRMGGRADPALSVEEACRWVVDILGENAVDVPFALVYLRDGDRAVLAANAGVEIGSVAAPDVIALEDGQEAIWPLADLDAPIVLAPPTGIVLTDPVWFEQLTQVILLPVTSAGETRPSAFLVAGVNPRRRIGETYRSFFELAAGHVATALAAARAYDEERRRAEALAELDRAKTAFFSNVSHEFRTPLTLMLGPLEESLAHADHLPPDERERIEIAHRNSLRLLRLVNSLLDFSRVEAGRVEANYEPVDLAALTADLASNFRAACERAGLTLTVEAAPLSAPVYVDRDMWEKILLNLLSNAFKFTLEGGITVKVDQRDGAALVEVRDTGSGIAAADLPRLFERFSRIENAQGRSHEGSGIGLALVQELVSIHGGTIAVESTPGTGSVFRITLPFGADHLRAERIDEGTRPAAPATGRAQAFVEEAMRWIPGRDADETASGTDLAAPSPSAQAERARIVLADDNADMRDYVRRLLHGRFDIEAVGDGEAALEVIRRDRPDLLITDVMMPRLDGFGLLKAVRGDPALAELPVVMLSARAGEEAQVEGIEAGADDYLVKPFSARELIARVTSTLELSRARKRAEAALQEEMRTLETLNWTGAAVAGELDLEALVQIVTDAGVELTGAEFGAFFYNVLDQHGESYLLYTLSGVERAAFEKYPMPRNTQVFGPTFEGEGVVRSGDITKDARYGKNAPYKGMPEGHLPVRSYLAVPVIGRAGEVIGGLFFGHAQPDRFVDRHERLVTGIAAQAAVGIDNARLFQAAQREIEDRRRAEAALRESEEAIRRLNEDLEARVDERTRELRIAEESLRQAQKMEAVGQLTGGIAHDFNNLLTIITGNMDIARRKLEDDGGDPRLQRLVGNAMKGAERAAALTQRLLAFSRRQPLAPKPLDVDRLVAGMSDLLKRSLGETVRLETITAPGLWQVEADPNQLESAIVNLAVNARDAMPQGGTLTIETANARLDEGYAANQAEVAPGNYVVVAVSDTGAGMSDETLARVFEPFFTTKEVGKGTGLGLSMVYGFVKQTGGHVKVYSEEGRGTTVKIYLPRLTGAHVEEATEEAGYILPGREGETILVVEDDEDVRAYSVELLRELGYHVLESHDGPAALRLLERPDIEIDLMFTDVVMPGMSGRELADAARRLRPSLRILYTSGYTRNAIVHGGRLDPGVEMIPKPFTYHDVSTRIRDLLDAVASGRLLVVDADPAARRAVIAALADGGFTVEEAATAAEAMGKLRASGGGFDAVILDAELPDRTGASILSEIRGLHRHLPLLVATGAGSTVDDRIEDDPCTSTVAKPYSGDRLMAALATTGIHCARSAGD